MGGFIKRDVPRVETTALNTKVNKELFDSFRDKCKEMGYPMNVMLETFMQQYARGRFRLGYEAVMKWKREEGEEDTLNTTFSKEIYTAFKTACKENGFFVKHVVMAFMEVFASGELFLEFSRNDNSI